MNLPNLYAEVRTGRRPVTQLTRSGLVGTHAATRLVDLTTSLPPEPLARVVAVSTSRTGRFIHQAITLDLGHSCRAVAMTYLVGDRPQLVQVDELVPAGDLHTVTRWAA